MILSYIAWSKSNKKLKYKYKSFTFIIKDIV